VCGKLSLLRNFSDEAVEKHRLEGATQEALSRPGVAGGWAWSAKSLTVDDLHLLRGALQKALVRVRFALGEGTVEDELLDTPEARERYVAEAERKAQLWRDEAKLRVKEVRQIEEELRCR
jgi:hypothetical protein